MRSLFILGTGGLAKEMAFLLDHVNRQQQRWDLAGFIGQSMDEVGRDLGFASVVGDDRWLLSGDLQVDLVIGIGHPKVKSRVLAPYLELGSRFGYPNLVHPSAIADDRRVAMGRGNAVTAGCIFTCDIRVGDFNLFNLQATVGHDARIGSYNVMNPSVNISGGVTIGDRVLIGTGAQVLENLSIGDDATVGAGAVVRSEVLEAQTVVGVPAKPIVPRAAG